MTYGLVGLPLSWVEFKHLLLGEWLASGFSMYRETFDYTAPLSAWTFQGIDFLFGRSRLAHWIISGLIIWFLAAFFNRTLLNNKVLAEPSYVPAFLFVIFSAATFDFFALTPQLLSLVWVIISMDYLIQRMDNVASDELFLFPGFFLGIAGMFYLPSIIFFLVFLIAMFVIVRAKPRRILLYVYGWLTANLIVLTILYLNGVWVEFWDSFFVEVFREKIYLVSIRDMLVWMAFPVLIFVLALFASLGSREGSLHVKTQQFMILILLASIGVVAIGGTLSGADLVFFIPVFTFFLSNYFRKIERRFWRIVLPNLMILGSVVVPLTGLNLGLFTSDLIVEEGELPENGKRLMIIGPMSADYVGNIISGPFLDERISRERLSDLDYYHKSTVFLQIFRKAQPEIIKDEWGAMEKIYFRFPEVEAMDHQILPSN